MTKTIELDDDDAPELTPKLRGSLRPASDLPPEVLAAFPKTRRPGQRGPQRAGTKTLVTIRLDQKVVDHFKAGGNGWQTRLNDALVGIIHPR